GADASVERVEGSSSGSGRVDVASIRREQITTCVRKLIVRSGLGAVTISNIAAELGTSRGVVSYHFPNKDEILHEALQAAIREASLLSVKAARQELAAVDLIRNVARLGHGQDWWPIYVAFLAKASVENFYREEIAAADAVYRSHLERTFGSSSRAVVVLALMKGLALQLIVDENLELEGALAELEDKLSSWTA
ncbi:TetR/AcrR family transcriptional regulator, partial [Georgenia sp. 10Sc9-8]|nr:TetR/AcrR family transcriptional regulator [Georgenia halotolerans]